MADNLHTFSPRKKCTQYSNLVKFCQKIEKRIRNQFWYSGNIGSETPLRRGPFFKEVPSIRDNLYRFE